MNPSNIDFGQFLEMRDIRSSFSSDTSSSPSPFNSDYNSSPDSAESRNDSSSLSSPMPSDASASTSRRTRESVEVCVVCGDRSSGYHYNALTCEGCKAFFSRKIQLMNSTSNKRPFKPCKNNRKCVQSMDTYLRRKCPSCRYQKCIQVGMLPECVLVQPQPIRPERAHSSFSGSFQSDASDLDSIPSSPVNVPAPNCSAGLSFQDKCLANCLEMLQEKYEKPSDENIHILSAKSQAQVENGDTPNDLCYEAIVELTRLTVELIVEFAKHLPGFDEIDHADKRTILQACSAELMMLRAARRYLYEQDCIFFANGLSYCRENYVSAGIAQTAEPLFKFCRRLHELQLDNVEHAFLSTIIIFSRRPGLNQPVLIESFQDRYVQTLKNYTDYRCSQQEFGYTSAVRLGKLLAILTEAQGLAHLNTDDCCGLIWKGKLLPNPLIDAYDPIIAQCISGYYELAQILLGDENGDMTQGVQPT